MKKIVYLTYNEELWSPLLRRQVVELLDLIQDQRKDIKLTLVSFFPWYWLIMKKDKLRLLKKSSEKFTFHLKLMPVLFPFPFPAPFFHRIVGVGWRPYGKLNPIMTLFLTLNLLPYIFWLRFGCGYVIFHCRSYPVSLPVLILKKLVKNIKFIFDPRSDYPEENITAGTWGDGSISFRFWKSLEAQFLKSADLTVCITQGYFDHFRQVMSSFSYKIIPNNVEMKTFSFDEQFRSSFRNKHKLNNALVFCYLGNMTLSGWHKPDIYAKLILRFRLLGKQHIFLFLVPENVSPLIDNVFTNYGILRDEYMVINPPYEHVSSFLSIADYGLLFLDRSKISLGTKIPEYLSIGLPSLVNSNIQGAASFVNRHKCGLVIDINFDLDEVQENDFLAINFHQRSGNNWMRELAREHFSSNSVAAKYIEVYENF